MVDTENGTIKPVPEQGKQAELEAKSAPELFHLQIADLEWHIEGIFPQGLLTFSAPPKYGKSFMALDVVIEICNGGSFFGRKCNKTGVLYFDLESNYRRPRDRLKNILQGREIPGNLYFVTLENRQTGRSNKIKKLGHGFEEQLVQQLDKYPDVGLVVIDVYGKIRPKAQRGDSKQQDDEAYAPMVEICNSRSVSIMVITHDRKNHDSEDFLANVSGSYGITGSSDTVWGLCRKNRTDADAVLAITGRDVEQQELAIQFDRKQKRWKYLGTAEEQATQRAVDAYTNSPITMTILALIERNKGQLKATPKEIIEQSEYLDSGKHKIYDTDKTVGKFIRNNQDFLYMIDKISLSKKRTQKGIEFSFLKEDALNNQAT